MVEPLVGEDGKELDFYGVVEHLFKARREAVRQANYARVYANQCYVDDAARALLKARNMVDLSRFVEKELLQRYPYDVKKYEKDAAEGRKDIAGVAEITGWDYFEGQMIGIWEGETIARLSSCECQATNRNYDEVRKWIDKIPEDMRIDIEDIVINEEENQEE